MISQRHMADWDQGCNWDLNLQNSRLCFLAPLQQSEWVDSLSIQLASPSSVIHTQTPMKLVPLKHWGRTSLVAQGLRIHLPMHGTWVRALVREDPTCRRATKPVHHNYWACDLEPASHNYWAHAPQLLKPVCLEPVLPTREATAMRSPRTAKKSSLRSPQLEKKSTHSNEDPTQPKIN